MKPHNIRPTGECSTIDLKGDDVDVDNNWIQTARVRALTIRGFPEIGQKRRTHTVVGYNISVVYTYIQYIQGDLSRELTFYYGRKNANIWFF